MQNPKPAHIMAIPLLMLAIILGSVIATASTAPVNVPASATLDLTKKPTLFLVGYAHLDTQWRWSYPQVIREFLPNTFNDNFKLFEKFPHYTFNWTGAGRYKLIKDYYPEAFEKIRAAVAAGRWFPNGVSWEENDANVPSVESQIRQFLQGREFFLKEFGTESNEFMLPDCFGFPAALPSVLYHCSIRGFSTQKLGWGSANGIPFNVGEWIGTDGNSIIAALNCGGYIEPLKEDPSRNPKWLKRLNENGEKSGIYADFIYMGTGDRGGAPGAKTVGFDEQGVTSADGPVRVISARADLMFNSISDAQMRGLPKYTGDLLLTQHSAGSITSQGYMKRWNRANELLADAAERASVAAWLLGAAPYPREKLNTAWQLMLRSQFHDILPGTSLPKCYEYSWNDEVLCMNTFAEALTGAVGAVASGMDTRVPDGAVPLVVYNPLSIDREDVVEAEVSVPGTGAINNLLSYGSKNSVQVFDSNGNPVPTQLISSREVADDTPQAEPPKAQPTPDQFADQFLSSFPDANRCHFVFRAKVPSVGFAVYYVKQAYFNDRKKGDPQKAAIAASGLKVTDRTLENARYRVTLNDAGDIASIFDKQATRELLAAPARLAFQGEAPDEYPAWNMDWRDRRHPPRGYVGDDGKARIEIVERGPVRVALRVTRDAEHSNFDQIISLAAGDAGNRIEISNTIDWRSKGCSLKATFPLTVSNPLATYNEDLGKIQRANNDPKKYEVPTHQWFDLTGTDGAYGVSVLTAAKYGSDKPSDNTVRLTLLYTPGVDKMSKMKDYKEQRWQDWGRHEFTYGIYAHAGDWRKGGSDWQALRMEQPLMAFTTTAHEGKLGRSFSLFKVDSNAVAIRAIKLAERSDAVFVPPELTDAPQTNANNIGINRDAVIVRLQELNGEPQTDVSLKLPCLASDSEVNGVETPIESDPSVSSVVAHRLSKPADFFLLRNFKKYQLRSFALWHWTPRAKLAPAISVPVTLPYNTNVFGYRGATTSAKTGFDGQGATIPAEMISDTIMSEGIVFKIGDRKSAGNAVRCEGQTIALPAGDFNRVYLLAAAAGGDTSGKFSVGGKGGAKLDTMLKVQNWGGYIGSWDNRIFKGEAPALGYAMDNELERIDTGFIKRDPVAWWCDHHYTKDGKDAIYSYCYLFKYALSVPAGAKTVTLPDNPNIRVLAMTAALDPAAGTQPARPLYDDFTDRKPIVIPEGWANSK